MDLASSHVSILSTDLKYQNCISLNFELPYCFIQIILINLVARQIPARYPSQIYSLEWNWDTDHKIVLTNAQWCHVNQQFVLQEEYRIVSLTTQTYNITTAHAPTCTPHWHTHSSALHTATHPCLPAPQTHVTHTPMCTHHQPPPTTCAHAAHLHRSLDAAVSKGQPHNFSFLKFSWKFFVKYYIWD